MGGRFPPSWPLNQHTIQGGSEEEVHCGVCGLRGGKKRQWACLKIAVPLQRARSLKPDALEEENGVYRICRKDWKKFSTCQPDANFKFFSFEKMKKLQATIIMVSLPKLGKK